MTPVLAALKLAGGPPTELDLAPWLFAGAAPLVARLGVSAFCAGDTDDADNSEEETVEETKGTGRAP